jgi:hypothetical protein
MKHNHPRWGKGRGAMGINKRREVKKKGRKRYLYVSKFFRR